MIVVFGGGRRVVLCGMIASCGGTPTCALGLGGTGAGAGRVVGAPSPASTILSMFWCRNSTEESCDARACSVDVVFRDTMFVERFVAKSGSRSMAATAGILCCRRHLVYLCGYDQRRLFCEVAVLFESCGPSSLILGMVGGYQAVYYSKKGKIYDTETAPDPTAFHGNLSVLSAPRITLRSSRVRV